jgi:hypothetical protein
VLLLAGATGAMIGAVTSVLPMLSNRAVNTVGQVLALGELPIIVWLVFPRAPEPERPPDPPPMRLTTLLTLVWMLPLVFASPQVSRADEAGYGTREPLAAHGWANL